MESIKGTHYLGLCDYDEAGTPRNAAEIEWELTNGKFTASGTIWNPHKTDIRNGGQCVDTIADLFPDDARALSILQVWKRYHLNDMRAGCEHPRALGWGAGYHVSLTLTDVTPAQRESLTAYETARAEPKRIQWLKEHAAELAESHNKRLDFIRLATAKGPTTAYFEAVAALLLSVAREGKTTRTVTHGNIGKTYTLPITGTWKLEIGKNDRDALLNLLNGRAAGAFPILTFPNADGAPQVGKVYKDSLSAPCPECGYFYGSAWLTEEIPADVIEIIQSWTVPATPEERAGEVDEDNPFSLAQLIEIRGIYVVTTRADNNPNAGGFSKDASHYEVILLRKIEGEVGARSMTTFFSMGSAHRNPPTAKDVIECLLMDAQSIEGESFEDWADAMGWDQDSRKAERCYKVIGEQAAALETFLGSDDYQAMIDGQ